MIMVIIDNLRTDLFLGILYIQLISFPSSDFSSSLPSPSFLIHLIIHYTAHPYHRLHIPCPRCLLLLGPLRPHNLSYLRGIDQLSLPSTGLDLVKYLLPVVLHQHKHKLDHNHNHKHHGENHNSPRNLNLKDQIRIDSIIDIPLLLPNLLNFSLLKHNPNHKDLDRSHDLLLPRVKLD